MRCDVVEEEEQVVTRFLGVLKPEIADIVSLQPYWTYTDVCKLALKVEKHIKAKSKGFTSRFTPPTRTAPPTAPKATTPTTLAAGNTRERVDNAPHCYKYGGFGHYACDYVNLKTLAFIPDDTSPIYDTDAEPEVDEPGYELKTRIWLYIKGKENEEMLIDSIENRPFQFKKEITIPGANGAADVKRAQMVADLSPIKKIRYDCDIKTTNIILFGVPVEIYTLINHFQTAKEIWDQVKELMEGIELTLQERESKLYDEFDRFVTPAKQAKNLHKVNFDQLYAFLKQNENDPKEVREMKQRHPHQLALLADKYNPPPPYSSSRSHYNPPAEFVVPSFLTTDDPIASLNKAMMFLSTALNSKVNTGKSQATGMIGVNNVGDVNANQSKVIKCYNCKDEGHIAKQYTSKKRAKDAEWLKEKMLLAQAQEAGVILHEDQQDFLADRLEDIDDDDKDLQLHTASNFNAYHVDAYDSYCDDEATEAQSSWQVFLLQDQSMVIQLTEYIEHIVSNNETCDELTSDSNVISYADYMVTIENDAAQYVPPPEQNKML
ncbi:reverse transcriptase domain-containing protein [Tanacetum coccineum]